MFLQLRTEQSCVSALEGPAELSPAGITHMRSTMNAGRFHILPALSTFSGRVCCLLARHHKQPELESCMRKAVFAGAVALAMVGPLLVSGVTPAAAQEVALTEGHIYRLKAALHLRAEQLSHWAPVEAALRAAIRNGNRGEETASNDGLVQKVRTRVKGYMVQVSALQGAYAAAGPLIASLDESQKRSGAGVIRALGGSAAAY